ncbi:unnamed protein product [Ectocarpus fasciculatus]
MPPAMAGEARPASASPSSTQRAELGAERDVGPLRTDRGSSGSLGNGATWAWDTLEEGHQQRNVVHLMASLGLLRTSFNSTTTANTASTTFATSSNSASSCEGGSEGEVEGVSPSGRSCLSSGSPSSAFGPPPTPPRRRGVAPTPTESDSSAKSTAASVPSSRARRQDHQHRRCLQHHPAEASVLGGDAGDDGHLQQAKTTKALTCVALSGFVAGGGAAVVQQVSLGLSNACRELASWSLTVTRVVPEGEEQQHSGELMPPRLADHVWPGSSAVALRQRGGGKDGREGGGDTQAADARLKPRRRITRVKIESDMAVTVASWPSTMRRLEFGDRFNSPVEGVDLPAGLEVIRFGDRFNQPVSRVRWPAALRELLFGNDFNQPASGMDLPAGLRRLDFGGRFNFSVSAMDLPEELRELRFGQGFNREISNVRWPPRLSRLDFCGELQQRVEDVAWPSTLTHVSLLGDFNQPINAVKWPAGLKIVRFGDRFRQPLAAAAGTAAGWPPRLEKIVVGRAYSKGLSGCVLLPTEELAGRSLSWARGNGGGGGFSQPASYSAPPVVVKCDGDDDGDDSGNNGVMMLAREGTLPTAEEDQALARYAVETTTAAAAVPGEGDTPFLDGGGDDDEQYWDNEEGAEEGERELPCLDVFGFEDCALDDMGEAWDPCPPPGSYDADGSAGRLGY